MADRTLIRGGWVVGWGQGGHQVLDGGVVVVEGDRIAFVGFPDDPACPGAESMIDARGKLVSPGLINLHGIANIDFQVLSIDVASRAGGYNRPASVLDDDTPHIFSDDDFRTSAEFSVATMLKAGNSGFAGVAAAVTKKWEDPKEEPYALAEAAERFGARAWIAHTDQHSFLPEFASRLPRNQRDS